MTRAEIIETEATLLRAQAVPYAVATVVRTLAATSAKPGARALILMAGSIAAGWIGGGSARSAIAKAALAAIGSGQPQYVSLRPEELLEIEGVQAGKSGTASGSRGTAVRRMGRWTFLYSRSCRIRIW